MGRLTFLNLRSSFSPSLSYPFLAIPPVLVSSYKRISLASSTEVVVATFSEEGGWAPHSYDHHLTSHFPWLRFLIALVVTNDAKSTICDAMIWPRLHKTPARRRDRKQEFFFFVCLFLTFHFFPPKSLTSDKSKWKTVMTAAEIDICFLSWKRI